MSGRSLGDGPVADCTEEAWDAVLAANLRSMYLVSRLAVPRLIAAGGGAFVAVGLRTRARRRRRRLRDPRVRGEQGGPRRPRPGDRGHLRTRGRACERGRARADRDADERPCAGRRRSPRPPARAAVDGDFGRPEDVAQAALYLAQAEFATGTVLPVDGGGRRSDATTGPRPRRHGRQARRARERRGRRDRHNGHAKRAGRGGGARAARRARIGRRARLRRRRAARAGRPRRQCLVPAQPPRGLDRHTDRSAIAEGFGLPVTLLNDGHAFALAETRIGARAARTTWSASSAGPVSAAGWFSTGVCTRHRRARRRDRPHDRRARR